MPTIQYVIQRGDTLHIIAKRFGVEAADIAEANGIENVAAGIGEEVGQDDLQPGDFVQIWRKPGVASGHSVIFKGWDGDKIQYWSSQGSTDGIAEHEENASNFDALVCARVTPEF